MLSANFIPISNVKPLFFQKPKVEFIEQLLIDPITPDNSDAPILIARDDHSIVISTFESGELICKLYGHNAQVTAAKALSEKIIVTGDESGELIIWDITPIPGENSEKYPRKSSKESHQERVELRKQHLKKRLQGHKNSITAIESVDARIFISISPDGFIKYWSIDTNEANNIIDIKKPILALVVLSPDEIIYCTEQDVKNEYAHCYDIFYHNLKSNSLNHRKFASPRYSKSLFEKQIIQIMLSHDGHLTLLSRSEGSRLHCALKEYMLSYLNDSPSKFLANGRYAFWDTKSNNVVVIAYPLEPIPAISTNELITNETNDLKHNHS